MQTQEVLRLGWPLGMPTLVLPGRGPAQAKFSYSLHNAYGHFMLITKQSADGHHQCWAQGCLKRLSQELKPAVASAGLEEA